jgi:hypothetical protein
MGSRTNQKIIRKMALGACFFNFGFFNSSAGWGFFRDVTFSLPLGGTRTPHNVQMFLLACRLPPPLIKSIVAACF